MSINLLVKEKLKNYLYQHWADSCLILCIAVTILLWSFSSLMPRYLYLIWLQFPVYLLHQFEEHVYPGNFRAFVNKEIFHSQQINFPLSEAATFWINILAIWFLFPAGALLAQHVSPLFGVLLPVFGLFNATLHILFLIIKRRYNPGALVSIFLNYPTGIYTLYILNQYGFLTTLSVSYAFILTLITHAMLVLFVIRANRRSLG